MRTIGQPRLLRSGVLIPGSGKLLTREYTAGLLQSKEYSAQLVDDFLLMVACDECAEWVTRPEVQTYIWELHYELDYDPRVIGSGVAGYLYDKHHKHSTRWWHLPVRILVLPLQLIAFLIGFVFLGPLYWLFVFLPWNIAHRLGIIASPPKYPRELFGSRR